MQTIISIVVLLSAMTGVIACNKGYSGGHGWGEPHPVIILPKPTLIPKLKQAFIDGKLSVDYHKIIAPSLKPLPYKKGVGWIGKGWGHNFNAVGGYGYDHYDYPFGVGKSGYLGVSYGKGFGYGKGVGKGGGFGIGYGKEIGLIGPYGHGPIGGIGLGHGHIGHGHIGHPVTPIIPHAAKLPIPHGPIGHIGHTVSQNSVTVVEKGIPHVGIPHGPIGNDLYGKK